MATLQCGGARAAAARARNRSYADNHTATSNNTITSAADLVVGEGIATKMAGILRTAQQHYDALLQKLPGGWYVLQQGQMSPVLNYMIAVGFTGICVEHFTHQSYVPSKHDR